MKENNLETFRLAAKYSEEVLCPQNAIDAAFFKRCDPHCIFMTKDKKECAPTFLQVWDNSDGRYNETLDELCNEKWQMPFKSLQSVWFSRLGEVSGVWHLIGLKTRCDVF